MFNTMLFIPPNNDYASFCKETPITTTPIPSFVEDSELSHFLAQYYLRDAYSNSNFSCCVVVRDVTPIRKNITKICPLSQKLHQAICQTPAMWTVAQLSVTRLSVTRLLVTRPGLCRVAHPDPLYDRKRVFASTSRRHASKRVKVTPWLSLSAN